MKTKITGKNIEITKAMKETIENKFQFLDKFITDTDSMSVAVSSRKTKIKIAVVVSVYGKIVKMEREVDNFYDGIDMIVDKLKNTVRRQHEFRVKQNRERIDEKICEKEEITEDSLIEVYKQITCTSMTEEKAVEEMETTGHDFYLFKNVEKDNHYCIVYRRFDGTYGIIEDVVE